MLNHRLGSFYLRFARSFGGDVVIQLFQGNCILRRQRFIASLVGLSARQVSLRQGHLRFGLVQRSFKGPGVDFKEELPRLNREAIFVVLSQHVSLNLRHDLSIRVPV